ncbi:ClpP/crotonase [Panus rudis PR-1116 ss-1]|nr:ClpP/crotonase [Panus rudis PR-1116 ss-1]
MLSVVSNRLPLSFRCSYVRAANSLSRKPQTPLRQIVRRGIQTQADAEAFLEQSQKQGVSFLSLNRPKAKNAISLRLLKELTECLEKVQFDKGTRVLIVRSSTLGSFCAGADLAERRTMTQVQVDKFLLDLRGALNKLENLPIPTIAAIDGPALGGGLELALACDLRVAGHSVTKIGLPETKLGIIPGAGGTQRLTRLLGLAKAKNLIFTGRALTAQQALDYGVVDYVSEAETSAVDRAVELATEISVNAPLALKAAKQAISRAPELALESGLDFERASYEPLLKTKDRVEALEAFKEKRQPVFKGE